MSSSTVIKTTSLYYSYSKGAKTLVNINMQVEQGSLYGFIGPNGSGKTTTLSLVLGLLKLQKGSIEVFGQELDNNRVNILNKTGTLIENPSLYGHLTAKENLAIYRYINGTTKQRVNEVLKMVGLDDTGSKKVKNFSLGMKQRLAIALALLPKPELLVLDEPTNGLDPNGIIELRELIKKLNREEGVTMLISSHILAEVEKMVSHIGIIFKGEMLFQGSLQELYHYQRKQSKLQINTSDNDAAIRILEEYHPEKLPESLSVSFSNIREVADINRKLLRNELDVYLLQPKENNLEQLFIDLTSSQS
ncbi:ABC transporter ATP-binding protein [Cesiribacter sp. SM1]|uniref:ABC transporter ATP-binding protein n=1 Tax=Cesiribacter sp. SM1 TaxID=2861196 RepID=UPI001CD7FDCE|nr:ABC transporter ATP-binding protein [Cesiribacter sp. SM1]